MDERSSYAHPVRPPTLRGRSRVPVLPSYSNAIEEKHRLTSRPSSWFITFDIPLLKQRRLKLPIPMLRTTWRFRTSKKGISVILWIVTILFTGFVFVLLRALYTQRYPPWTEFIIGKHPTLVFGREDLQKIWEWEIASGHYPSSRRSRFNLLDDQHG